VLADGVELMRELAAKMPRIGPELGDKPTGEALREAIRRGVVHYYHPVGTCALGAVVDEDGAVIGAESLYVADCSIIPTIPRANTNVPAAVIGLRVAEALSYSAAAGRTEITRPRRPSLNSTIPGAAA
jgi:choline dehydrogenase